MPEMSGVEVLRRAKAIRPEATRLLFTAYADIRAVIDAINQGNVFRYITKPWDPEELEAVIRQAVEHHDLIVERRGSWPSCKTRTVGWPRPTGSRGRSSRSPATS